jgi:CBS domain-containing protein
MKRSTVTTAVEGGVMSSRASAGALNPRVDVSELSGGHMKMRVLVGDSVACVRKDASLEEVAGELALNDVGLLVVGSPSDVAGVVSERDLVHAIASGAHLATTCVTDVASTHLLWCDLDATVDEVAELMMTRYARHALVEEDGRLVGIVSARDLLGAYLCAEESMFEPTSDDV